MPAYSYRDYSTDAVVEFQDVFVLRTDADKLANKPMLFELLNTKRPVRHTAAERYTLQSIESIEELHQSDTTAFFAITQVDEEELSGARVSVSIGSSRVPNDGVRVWLHCRATTAYEAAFFFHVRDCLRESASVLSLKLEKRMAPQDYQELQWIEGWLQAKKDGATQVEYARRIQRTDRHLRRILRKWEEAGFL